jgi:hypothetical protein
MRMFVSRLWIDLYGTLPSCEQEPMSTGKPVAVTDRIMASFIGTRQDFGFDIGVGPDRRN